jgi:16S rRNA (cytidine1402-2'-O)-methyltransferase
VPLWVVATPIGNLADVSPRARETLARAVLVLCEDTRRTRTLYQTLGLAPPRLLSC